MALRILHVNKTDTQGGAAIAASRIHEALREAGFDSWMLVDEKHGTDPYTITHESWWQQKMQVWYARKERAAEVELQKPETKTVFSSGVGTQALLKVVATLKPDVVHLHWVNRGMVDIKALSKLNVPIVWTLHDEWAYTGGCHYSGSCTRFQTGCGSCPLLKKSAPEDLTAVTLRKKQELWKGTKMHLVGCSSWITERAASSTLVKKLGIRTSHILNAINTKVYYETSAADARKALGLPAHVPLLLFGAAGATEDPRKGFKYLQQALTFKNWLPADMQLVAFGSATVPELGWPVHNLGVVKDPQVLIQAYRAASAFVAPSVQDNLPNTIVEAMACGTPVAGFDVGGLPDLVLQGKTGYLAPPESAEDLAKALALTLALTLAQAGVMRHNCLAFTQLETAYSRVANRYHRLYHELINT